MYDKTYIRFIDAHTECDCRHYNINFFHKEFSLVSFPGSTVKTGMVWEGFYAINNKCFSQFLHFFSAKAVNNTWFIWVLFYKFNNILNNTFCFWANFVIEVFSVKWWFIKSSIIHFQVFPDVLLNFWCCCCCERNYRNILTDSIYYWSYSSVFRAKVMSPFRDTVSLIYGIKRDLNILQKLDIILFS